MKCFLCKLLATSYQLFLQTEFLHQSTVRTLVIDLQVLQMLAAVGDEPQKSAAAVCILAVFIQMNRQFLDSSCQNSDLHLRRPCVGIVAARFADFVLLLALRKH